MSDYKMLEECQTTNSENSGWGMNGLHGTPDVLTANKLEDGGASGKGAKPRTEQQP